MVDIQSTAAEIRRGIKKKKKIDRRKKLHGKNIMPPPITEGGHNNRSRPSKLSITDDLRPKVTLNWLDSLVIMALNSRLDC